MHDRRVAIIGGGIVGITVAHTLLSLRPGLSVAVFEKEPMLAAHQTGRNSGVIHSGVYYKSGSLKARWCTEGKRMLEEFCEKQQIPFECCGKVVVAVSDEELPALVKLHERSIANGLRSELIDPERLREIEPAVKAVKALWVPGTGIVDYRSVVEELARLVRERGGVIHLSTKFLSCAMAASSLVAVASNGDLEVDLLINCGGVFSDRIAKTAGFHPRAMIVPFRGEYFELVPGAQHLCRGLIYPVPDPRFPFLGVHFTKMIGGGVEAGPNAVFAFGRENYTKWNIDVGDTAEALRFPGFRNLIRQHWKMGFSEFRRSISKELFTRALQRLVPDIRSADLLPAESGIRAQAVAPDGSLVDDFLVDEGNRMIHVLNAPSPAATASFAIAKEIAGRAIRQLS